MALEPSESQSATDTAQQGWRGRVRAVEWSLTHRVLPLVVEPLFRMTGRRPRTTFDDLADTRRILVVRLDEIGDVVLTGPFLRELRGNAPNAAITLVVKPSIKDLVQCCPYVDEVLTYDLSGPRALRSVFGTWRAFSVTRRQFWDRGFDLAIVPRWDADQHHSSLVAYLSGARVRVGYSEHVAPAKSRLNAGLNDLFTHVLDELEPRHEVERNLSLIDFLGGTIRERRLELWTSDEDERVAEGMLPERRGRGDTGFVALGPGAGHPKRCWPIENFVALGAWLLEAGYDLVVVGGKDARHLGLELAARLDGRVINAVGDITLGESGALLRRCDLFIGNDAGPMHLAAAAGIPVVEISCHPLNGDPAHENSPVRFGPWGVPHIVVQPEHRLEGCEPACQAAQAHCIRAVTVDRVTKAAERALGIAGTTERAALG